MGQTRTDRSRTPLLVVAFLAAAIVAAILVALTGDSEGDTTADQAPEITLEYFDGSTEQLADLQGTPVVLNFWASWCPACIGEMPSFAEVHRNLGDRVEFIGVNTQEVDMDAALDLVERTGVEYRMVHDRDGAIYNQFGGIAMPTTVFISADGTVARVHAGTVFADDLTEIIETELLG